MPQVGTVKARFRKFWRLTLPPWKKTITKSSGRIAPSQDSGCDDERSGVLLFVMGEPIEQPGEIRARVISDQGGEHGGLQNETGNCISLGRFPANR